VLEYEKKATRAINLQIRKLQQLEDQLKKAKLGLDRMRAILFWSRKALREQMPSTSNRR
jgi:hypothetical protein